MQQTYPPYRARKYPGQWQWPLAPAVPGACDRQWQQGYRPHSQRAQYEVEPKRLDIRQVPAAAARDSASSADALASAKGAADTVLHSGYEAHSSVPVPVPAPTTAAQRQSDASPAPQ